MSEPTASDPDFESQKRSDRSRDELLRIIARLESNHPKLFEILRFPGVADEELYQRATGRLVSLLLEEEPSLKGKKYSEVTPVRYDIVRILAGRL
ncbi:MAG: hypothetical protein J2O44_05890 [Porphyrobacter sp.]|nr:hypothetical protein [Porphyrobacter sp.]